MSSLFWGVRAESVRSATEAVAGTDGSGSALAVAPRDAAGDGGDDEFTGREAKPKSSEPFMRALWSAAHRVVAPRTLFSAVQYVSPAFSDCVTHFDLRGQSRRVAITIDDAPSDAGLMHRTLDALRDFGVRATFFVVANFCRDAARLATLRRAVAEGHELGNHLCDDASSQHMTDDEFRGALGLCDELIASLDPDWADRPFRWFRPPQGYMSRSMKKILAERGYSSALADVFPLDTEVRSVEWLVDFVVDNSRPGSIVLLHAPDVRRTKNGRKHERQNNADVFPLLFPKLQEAFDLGTLSDLALAHRDALQAEQEAARAAEDDAAAAAAAAAAAPAEQPAALVVAPSRSAFGGWFSSGAPAPAS